MRYQSHIKDYLKAANSKNISHSGEDTHSSWMWEHINTHHRDMGTDGQTYNGQRTDDIRVGESFKFSVLGKHRELFSRQLEEAIRINKALGSGFLTDVDGKPKQVVCLNRREEHFAPFRQQNYGEQRE